MINYILIFLLATYLSIISLKFRKEILYKYVTKNSHILVLSSFTAAINFSWLIIYFYWYLNHKDFSIVLIGASLAYLIGITLYIYNYYTNLTNYKYSLLLILTLNYIFTILLCI